MPDEFKIFEGIALAEDEQVCFYRNKSSEPFASIYRGMGTYWVICRSLDDRSKFCFSILGAPNPYHREQNREQHLKDNRQVSMTARECADALFIEMNKF